MHRLLIVAMGKAASRPVLLAPFVRRARPQSGIPSRGIPSYDILAPLLNHPPARCPFGAVPVPRQRADASFGLWRRVARQERL